MHANVQLRFNPVIGREAPYYRLKESYRDVRGIVHSLIVLNVGFEPSLKPIQVKRIAQADPSLRKQKQQVTFYGRPKRAFTRRTPLCRKLLATHD